MFGIDLFGSRPQLSMGERFRMEAYSAGREFGRGVATAITGVNPWKPEPATPTKADVAKAVLMTVFGGK